MQNTWDLLPAEFLERVRKIVPADQLTTVLVGLTVRRPTTFRTNTLKITTEELKNKLAEKGFIVRQIDWYEDAFVLESPTKKELVDSDIYKEGLLYVQSLSSMIPPLVLDPKENETVCDLTAAPGSKTTQMAARMKNTGKIIANDKSRIRLYKLEANLKMQGVTNTEVTYMAGQAFWKNYPEYFDKTLVDVPCSLEGRITTTDPKSYAEWSPKKAKELVQIQKYLLRAGISSTKVGGTIVYSTCTISTEENEGVLDWILDKEKDALEVEKIELTIPGSNPGIVELGNKKFNPEVTKALRIFPSELMEGFFVVKLKKLKSTVHSFL